MAVMMILPDSEAGALHAWRRVTIFPRLNSTDRLTTITLIAHETDRNGIIPLTFMA
jgi:hypothetical protein